MSGAVGGVRDKDKHNLGAIGRGRRAVNGMVRETGSAAVVVVVAWRGTRTGTGTDRVMADS